MKPKRQETDKLFDRTRKPYRDLEKATLKAQTSLGEDLRQIELLAIMLMDNLTEWMSVKDDLLNPTSDIEVPETFGELIGVLLRLNKEKPLNQLLKARTLPKGRVRGPRKREKKPEGFDVPEHPVFTRKMLSNGDLSAKPLDGKQE